MWMNMSFATQEPGETIFPDSDFISFDLQNEVIGQIILSHEEQ